MTGTYAYDGCEYETVHEILEDRLTETDVDEKLEQQTWPATKWPHPDDINQDDYDVTVSIRADIVADAHDCLNHLEIRPTIHDEYPLEAVAWYQCQWSGEAGECDARVQVKPAD